MKYTEFKEKVRELDEDLYLKERGDELFVEKDEKVIITISKKRQYSFDNRWMAFPKYIHKKELLYLVVELANSPIETREKEKRYYYYLPYLREGYNYLSFDTKREQFTYSNLERALYNKAQFTAMEFEVLSRRFNINENSHRREEV